MAAEAEIEGVVSNRVSNFLFDIAGTPVDATDATFEPAGLVVMDGAFIEVEGSLEGGVLIAENVSSEEETEAQQNVVIEAAVTTVDGASRTLTILGVTVVADGQTKIEDDRDDDENFIFGEIQPADWLEIEGIQTGPSTLRALCIRREVNGTDVLFEGPVSFLDANSPALAILGQFLPIDSGTLYFDSAEQSRTEEEFFRSPGDVMLGDVVRATDFSAANLQILTEADEIELEDE